MTNKELRKLNRLELLEILLEQQKQIAGLEEALTDSKKTIAAKEERIKALTTAGRLAMKDLAKKEVELASRDSRLAELKKQLDGKENEIGQLGERLGGMIERKLDGRNEELKRLGARIEENLRDAELNKAEKRSTEQDAEFNAREQALIEYEAVLTLREQTLAKEENRLAEKVGLLEKCGSLADASLALTDLFTEAQKAVDLYLENVRKLVEKVADGKASQTALQTRTTDIANSRGTTVPSDSTGLAARPARFAQINTVPAERQRPRPEPGADTAVRPAARKTTTNTIRIFDKIWKKDKQ